MTASVPGKLSDFGVLKVPLYSYQCDTCAHTFELRQGFDAEPQQECPECKGIGRRMFHAVGIIYKGSGFYTTDYQRPKPSTSDSTARKESDSPTSNSSSSDSD